MQVSKIYGRYLHSFGNVVLHLNYLSVLHNNIAITDGGDAYGVGVVYNFNKNAQNSYFTTALKLYAHYASWHFGTAAFLVKEFLSL